MSNAARQARLEEGIVSVSPISLIPLVGGTVVTTTAVDTSPVTNTSYLGVVVGVYVQNGASAMTIRFQGWDPAASTYSTFYTPATLTVGGQGYFSYHVGMGSPVTAAALPLPTTWRVELLSGTTTASTVSVSYFYVPFPVAP